MHPLSTRVSVSTTCCCSQNWKKNKCEGSGGVNQFGPSHTICMRPDCLQANHDPRKVRQKPRTGDGNHLVHIAAGEISERGLELAAPPTNTPATIDGGYPKLSVVCSTCDCCSTGQKRICAEIGTSLSQTPLPPFLIHLPHCPAQNTRWRNPGRA